MCPEKGLWHQLRKSLEQNLLSSQVGQGKSSRSLLSLKRRILAVTQLKEPPAHGFGDGSQWTLTVHARRMHRPVLSGREGKKGNSFYRMHRDPRANTGEGLSYGDGAWFLCFLHVSWSLQVFCVQPLQRITTMHLPWNTMQSCVPTECLLASGDYKLFRSESKQRGSVSNHTGCATCGQTLGLASMLSDGGRCQMTY